jgi:hypothetical protein
LGVLVLPHTIGVLERAAAASAAKRAEVAGDAKCQEPSSWRTMAGWGGGETRDVRGAAAPAKLDDVGWPPTPVAAKTGGAEGIGGGSSGNVASGVAGGCRLCCLCPLSRVIAAPPFARSEAAREWGRSPLGVAGSACGCIGVAGRGRGRADSNWLEGREMG